MKQKLKSIWERIYPLYKNTYRLQKSIGRYGFHVVDETFSTNCEDLILARLAALFGIEKGGYVDVGANHPVLYSNTLRFYEEGWRGINIDPLPESIAAFQKMRPNDINLNVGCSDQTGTMTYYSFDTSSYNTMNEQQAEYNIRNGISRLISKTEVPVMRLQDILDEYMPAMRGRSIDIMDIDVEDYEYAVVQGNDWERYRPKIIVVECLTDEFSDMQDIYRDPTISFLIEREYRVVAKVFHGAYLVDTRLLSDR